VVRGGRSETPFDPCEKHFRKISEKDAKNGHSRAVFLKEEEKEGAVVSTTIAACPETMMRPTRGCWN